MLYTACVASFVSASIAIVIRRFISSFFLTCLRGCLSLPSAVCNEGPGPLQPVSLHYITGTQARQASRQIGDWLGRWLLGAPCSLRPRWVNEDILILTSLRRQALPAMFLPTKAILGTSVRLPWTIKAHQNKKGQHKKPRKFNSIK